MFALASCAEGAPADGDFEGTHVSPSDDAGTGSPSPPSTGGFNTETSPTEPHEPKEVHVVYGHSATTLYRLDPETMAISVVGDFKNCEGILDIALDEASTIYGVSNTTLYTIDKDTAECTPKSAPIDDGGRYPTSLSFVPKGTVDPNEEALVGFDDGDYVRIDRHNGSRTVIGSLGGDLVSSGDIVSVKGGNTYLTVKGKKNSACYEADCLVQIHPSTGKLLKNWGPIEHKRVFGLGFWAGKVYGFDQEGNLFAVAFGSNKVVTTTIAVPNKPVDLSFWGAGSSTSAPLAPTPQ
ncbi:MAG TPA: hypothetical protein VM580_25385 [Labilithrix sp.]|nr:hypothetical protein [Labilithrix sp.]